MADYKAVFTDLDGTLLDEQGRVSPETREVLERLRARGIPVFVATGRSVCAALKAVDGLGLTTPFICYNGAVVYDPITTRWLHHRTLEEHVTHGLLELARAHALFYFLYHEDAKVTLPARHAFQADFYGRLENIREVARFEDLPRRAVTKLSIFSPDAGSDREIRVFLAALEPEHYVERFPMDAIPGFREFNFHATDVHPQGGGKGEGMRFVMRRLGLEPSEVIAIGDHQNDLSMLREAGLAVAVGDAPPDILDAAHEVIDHASGEGVARFLRRMFGL